MVCAKSTASASIVSFVRFVPAAKRSKLLASALCLAVLFAFLIRAALVPTLPSSKNPIVFYANQQRDDFRLVFQTLLSSAQHSIDITMYAITDEELIKRLYQKAHQGLLVKIWHDKKSGSTPLSPPILATAVKTKGLMHRKIVITDDTYVFLGSANMTTSSLVLHDNISVGFYCPDLAQFIKAPASPYHDFLIDVLECRVWLLPDSGALDYMIQQ